jgi:hypothetical protein
MTGIDLFTLRNQERRYQTIVAVRGSGGQRAYRSKPRPPARAQRAMGGYQLGMT